MHHATKAALAPARDGLPTQRPTRSGTLDATETPTQRETLGRETITTQRAVAPAQTSQRAAPAPAVAPGPRSTDGQVLIKKLSVSLLKTYNLINQVRAPVPAEIVSGGRELMLRQRYYARKREREKQRQKGRRNNGHDDENHNYIIKVTMHHRQQHAHLSTPQHTSTHLNKRRHARPHPFPSLTAAPCRLPRSFTIDTLWTL